ncbi:MAG: isopentenyl-diphosphate Delta-isomerase [Planctomycetota bacterium]|nr:isopentenyl-diphosphate Delta-isomerase [Planctomycetota bacterium]
MSTSRTRRVSFDDEPLILVDEDNNIVGHLPKADVHAGDGLLHRAFSVFLFDAEGRLLLQQRSASKPLWPLFWANSCCSHPRRGETEAEAASRRVLEELGIEAELEYVYTFTYHARYEDKGSEHERCSVFLGRVTDQVQTNENEIAAVRWLTAEEVDAALAAEPERYSPWLKMEWARLRGDFADTLARYTSA